MAVTADGVTTDQAILFSDSGDQHIAFSDANSFSVGSQNQIISSRNIRELRIGGSLITNLSPLAGWPLERHPYFLETSVPGVFVAGDVRSQSVKRVASAVGEGAMAVSLIHRYLELL